MRKRRSSCAELSSIYREIKNHKHNGRVLANGDIQVGKDLAISSKDSILYKI
jgi:hypothetical protein